MVCKALVRIAIWSVRNCASSSSQASTYHVFSNDLSTFLNWTLSIATNAIVSTEVTLMIDYLGIDYLISYILREQ